MRSHDGPFWHRRSLCGGGDALGEVAFFTEIAQLEMVRTVSVCRILVIPRMAYNSIASAFPIGARAILTNLLSRAQEVSLGPYTRPNNYCTRSQHLTQSRNSATSWHGGPHTCRARLRMLLLNGPCNRSRQHSSG